MSTTEHITSKTPEQVSSEAPSESAEQIAHKSIFDEQLKVFTNEVIGHMERMGIKNHVIVMINPQDDKGIVFMTGEKYEIAKLLANILRDIKSDIARELDT